MARLVENQHHELRRIMKRLPRENKGEKLSDAVKLANNN